MKNLNFRSECTTVVCSNLRGITQISYFNRTTSRYPIIRELDTQQRLPRSNSPRFVDTLNTHCARREGQEARFVVRQHHLWTGPICES